jgi:hypothetical protein
MVATPSLMTEVEKNLEAFLPLDPPGTKIVIGSGPEEPMLRRRFPQAKFLGLLENGALARTGLCHVP